MKFALSQKFPSFGTRKARGDKAAAEAEAALHRFYATRDRIVADLKRAYFQYGFLGESIRVTEAQIEILRFTEEIVRSKYSLGLAGEDELLRVEIEAAGVQDRLESFEQMRPSMAADLNRTLGRPAQGEIPWPSASELPPPCPPRAEVYAKIASANPELSVLDSLAESSTFDVALARKEGHPDFTVGIDYTSVSRPRKIRPDRPFPASLHGARRLLSGTSAGFGGAMTDLYAVGFADEPISYRSGGDDNVMPWHRLEVVPPPMVENIQIQLTPPAYTGREPERLPKGVSHLAGLLGTRVDITADLNKPLQFGKLHVKDTLLLPVELLDGNRRFRTSFVIEEAGVYSYWFELKDQQDFEDPEAPRYEIRGIADSPPKVYIETPTSDRNVTADAAIPLRIIAEDDLSLKDLRLQFRLSNMDPNQEESLRFPLENRDRKFAEVELTWELSRLPLAEGMQIVLHAEAEDFYDLNPERHLGRSVSRMLTIVSAEEKKNELSSRQSELLENIERAVKTQTQSREQVGELLLQLQKAGQLRSEDVDLLKRVEFDQKHLNFSTDMLSIHFIREDGYVMNTTEPFSGNLLMPADVGSVERWKFSQQDF
ncbi:MAG: TolC family protein [Planctomycetes bacterium]|nr:TolC family protein [Planctomycetota bacterium]